MSDVPIPDQPDDGEEQQPLPEPEPDDETGGDNQAG